MKEHQMKFEKAIAYLTSEQNCGPVFAFVLFFVFVILPLVSNFLFERSEYMLLLSAMATACSAAILAGWRANFIDWLLLDCRFKIKVPFGLLHASIWLGFLVFVVVVVATADSVPIVSALSGDSTTKELDLERAAFLKMREGWQVSFGYIGGIFTGVLLPYSMVSLFLAKSRFRYASFFGFLSYSQMFLQKALFLQVIIPFLYLVAQRRIWNYYGFLILILASVGILYVNTVLSRGTDDGGLSDQSRVAIVRPLDGADAVPFPTNFFSASYRPRSSADHLVWRAIAVPIFTARDALVVFDEVLDGRHLLGATSSAVAFVTGAERVNVDAEVHGYQFEDKVSGRSNATFFTEGYINFWWIGVIGYGFIAGQIFRLFRMTNDVALKALWPLFAYNIIQASLIGTMLSSGYALVLLIGLFLQVKTGEQTPAKAVGSAGSAEPANDFN